MAEPPEPPRAPRRPTVLRHGEDVRVDDWYWLRERDNPEVLAHLEAENEYTAAILGPLEPHRERLFEEIKRRVVETDVAAPVRWGTYQYFARTIEGRQYPVHCRRPAAAAGPAAHEEPGRLGGEEVLLDENALARPDEYFALRGLAVSPAQRLLAYAVDRTGGERAQLRFRDLDEARDLPDEVPDTYYGLAWADERTVLYVRPDEAMRPFQVWRHVLGEAAADDAIVFEEPDERFYVSVRRARSGWVVLETASKTTSEAWLVDPDRPEEPATVVHPREPGLEYHVEPHRGRAGTRLFIVTNADGARDFQVVVAPAATPGRAHWEPLVPPQRDVRVERVDAFARYLVVSDRADGLPRVRAIDLEAGTNEVVDTGDAVATTWLGGTPEFDTDVIRVVATSLVLPTTDYDYALPTRTAVVVKRQRVDGYEPDRFETARLWARAEDGEAVPISLIRPRGAPLDGTGAMLLYGYGAYEISIDPTFSISRLSLLERGVTYAIAHVRGGGELGRRWYEDGRLDHKRNTFTDFLACADHLVAEGHVAPERLVARGGSAGGLLMGAALNLAPTRWRAVVAEVPFVDCLTTMLDPSLPLTVTEWDEWGNPAADEQIYAYLRGYSPYDNVHAAPYPAILVTAGVNDPRVQYWEPAKWVQRLRTTTTGDQPTLLKTELGAGHHGRSGRYDTWREEAFVLAFVLDAVGAGDADPPAG